MIHTSVFQRVQVIERRMDPESRNTLQVENRTLGVGIVITFFEYNWQIRDEWFEWCEQVTTEELLKTRTGGMGSILHTFFHIIEVEHSWLRSVQNKEDLIMEFEEYQTLERMRDLSNTLRDELVVFLQRDAKEKHDRLVKVTWEDCVYPKSDIFHHVIAHEIHHIGQLSIWARELGLKPVSANFIDRELKPIDRYGK